MISRFKFELLDCLFLFFIILFLNSRIVIFFDSFMYIVDCFVVNEMCLFVVSIY